MNFYFVQHGKALPKETDKNRPLSEDGITETNIVATKLLTSEIEVSKIFHSGKLRAAQTAEIFANKLGAESDILDSGMNPNDDAALFTLNLLEKNNNSMYVGHLPHMQKVVSYLLNDDESSHSIVFQNSAVANLQITNDVADIRWYITPSILK